MYLTTLKLNRALEWFLTSQYDYLLMYVCGSTRLDYVITHDFIQSKELIDRQTGKLVCFLHFVENIRDFPTRSSLIQANHDAAIEDFMMYHIKTEQAENITRKELYYGVGLQSTYETTDEICNFFNIPRHKLPAFILVYKDNESKTIESLKTNYTIFTIKRKEDLDIILNPIKLINDYIDETQKIKKKLSILESIPSTDDILAQIESISTGIKRLQSFDKNMLLEDRKRIIDDIKNVLISYDIQENSITTSFPLFKKSLKTNGMLKVFLEKHHILFNQYKKVEKLISKPSLKNDIKIQLLKEQLVVKQAALGKSKTKQTDISSLMYQQKHIDELYENKLNELLLIEDSTPILSDALQNRDILIRILNYTFNRQATINNIINDIKQKIRENEYDIFISCKSEDYKLAERVFNFLNENNHHPFLASQSLRAIGSDLYSDVISEVIDHCEHMIVFATDISYVEAYYVRSEWSMFCNEIKAGRKRGKLFSIISNQQQGSMLPIDLRCREVFSISNYKERLNDFLKDN